MIYSASRQKTFCRCPREYYHSYIQGYKQAMKHPWLQFGSNIDDLLAIYDTEGFLKMMENIPRFFSDPYELIDVRVLLEHYQEKFGDKILPVIDLEERPGNQWHFQYNLDPPHVEESDIVYQGYLDKVTEVKGWVSFVERKTTSQAINYTSAYWNGLETDKQVVGYSWAVGKAIENPVNKAVYEVLRKPASVNAKLLKRVDNKKNPLSLDDYEANVREYFKDPKQTMVARKSLWIPQSNRDEWVHDLVADDDTIKNMKLNQAGYESQGIDGRYAWPRCDNSCDAFGGCLFAPVCSGETEVESLQTVYIKGE